MFHTLSRIMGGNGPVHRTTFARCWYKTVRTTLKQFQYCLKNRFKTVLSCFVSVSFRLADSLISTHSGEGQSDHFGAVAVGFGRLQRLGAVAGRRDAGDADGAGGRRSATAQRPHAVDDQPGDLARGDERRAEQGTLQRVDNNERVPQRRPVGERSHEAQHPAESHHHWQLHVDYLHTHTHTHTHTQTHKHTGWPKK